MTPAQRHLAKVEARKAGGATKAAAIDAAAARIGETAARFHATLSGLSLAARKAAASRGAAVIAQAANDNAPDGEGPADPAAAAYQLMLARLGADLRRLKSNQSMEWRAALKRQLLPEYEAYVDGWLGALARTGQAVQDEIVMTVMIWRLDVGDFTGALAIGEVALAHGLRMPERFKRSVAAFLVEQIADAAIRAFAVGEGFAPEPLVALERLSGVHDMPDEVRARLFKALGLAYGALAQAEPEPTEGEAEPEVAIAGQRRSACNAALAALRRALELDVRVGVKKEIERMERLAKALEPPA